GFAVTELEIVTIGYALLNFGTYFLWWNKPLGVRYPSPEKSEGSRMEMIQEGFRAVVAYIRFRDSSDDTAKLIQLISLPLLDDDPLRLYITVYSIAAAF
ncbi:hypothetical protein MPER_00261, partial [Moniliophthora perniciosa FA553]